MAVSYDEIIAAQRITVAGAATSGYVVEQLPTLSGSAGTVAMAVAAMAQPGAAEVVIEPSGPGIAHELATFVCAVRS